MSTPRQTFVVSGSAGFIGSCLVRQLVLESSVRVVSFDALTYAGNPKSLGMALGAAQHVFVKGDICDAVGVSRLFEEYRPSVVMHLAAESHVDRSINAPAAFVQTNVVGTLVMLEAALAYWRTLDGPRKESFRFHHISTDEVFGSLGPSDPAFHESTPYAPNSPYSASKAASDHLVRAWHHTYGLPTLITNCSNNYGPYQFPEKLIPVVILSAVEGRPIPVYGDGRNIRDWLYVEDHARALRQVVERGRVGSTYNIGGNAERSNLEVVTTICRILDELRPAGAPHERHIQFVTDRPGHDRRYAIDATRMREEIGWTPVETFESGLRKTVEWYLANTEWLAEVRSGEYRRWMTTHYGTDERLAR